MQLAHSYKYYLNRRLWKRVKSRIKQKIRKSTKNEFDDQVYLFNDTQVKVIFDAGANIGFISKIYSQKFKEANLYCFEPNPSLHEILLDTFKDNSKIKTYPYALSNKVDNNVPFLINKKNGSSSFFNPTQSNRLRFDLSEPIPDNVQTITIDEFCQNEQIIHIDILKLDIEGAEVMALEGARIMLENSNIDLIYTEISFIPLYENKQTFHEVSSFLMQFDYLLYNIYGFGESEIYQAITGNAIFLSKRMRNLLESSRGKRACGW